MIASKPPEAGEESLRRSFPHSSEDTKAANTLILHFQAPEL